MLSLYLWQFGVIDYLEYEEQSKLIKLIYGLELTNLIGIEDLTDKKLKEYKYVKFLDARCNNKITDKGIKHMYLHTLYANNKITDEGIKHMTLHTLNASWNYNITDEGLSI
jgi:hypothetical protein